MPVLFTRVRNSDYQSQDNGADHDTPQTALAKAVRSAVDMAADEIERGVRSAAVEVIIEQEDGTCLLTSVVTVSVSPLMPMKPGMQEPTSESEHRSKGLGHVG